MPAAKAIYRAPLPIPAEGIETGDLVIVRPSDPTFPVEIVKRRDRHALVRLMGEGHLEAMILLGGDLAPPLSPARAPRRPEQQRLPLLSVLK